MINQSKSTIAIPPGATIKELLDDRGMTQKEFAKRMGMTEKHISHLINGKSELTHDVSLRLELVLGVPASFWNNLETVYREKLARVEAENSIEYEYELAKQMPYSKMANLGWVPATRNPKEKVLNLRKFFEVAKLDILNTLCVPGIAYRKTGENDKSDYALAAWAQKAKLEARKITTAPIDIQKLLDSVPVIRSMTIKSPSEFCEKLRTLLCECGIAIVFLPHIGGSFLHGASFYDGNHIVLGLTVRGKDADRFWFSLFHELNHIIRGHISGTCTTTHEQEIESDQFAKNTLIPIMEYEKFIKKEIFNRDTITEFAKEVGIAPGIVVGRLQNDNLIPHNWYNDLKIRYKISG